jgi:hypothetical protein
MSRPAHTPSAYRGISPYQVLDCRPVPVPFQWLLAHSERVERGFLTAGFLVLFFLLPHALFGDDQVRFNDLEALLHHGSVSAGHFSFVMPLVSSPFVLLGSVVGSPEWWATRFNVIVIAVGTFICLRLLRDRVDPTLLRRTLLILLFGSLLTNRLRDYNAEVLTATLFAIGILCLATRQHVVAGWSAMVIGTVNTPAILGALSLVAVVEMARNRRLRFLLPIVAAALLIMTEDWIRRGGPFATGYGGNHGIQTILPYSGRPGFSYPFLLGLASILFSFGRGLLFFTPGLALWLNSRTRSLAAPYRRSVDLMLLVVCGLILVYAKWWAWYGGLAWGPRFFTFAALPSSLLIALRLRSTRTSALGDALTLLALTVSAWVALSGAIADPAALGFCIQHYSQEPLCWYVPDFSSLWQPILNFPPLSLSAGITAAFCLLVFAYFAAPLVASIAREARTTRRAVGREAWRF